MRNQEFEFQFRASPFISSCYTPERPSYQYEPLSSSQTPSSSSQASPNFETIDEESENKKFGRKANSYAYRICEHVRLGPKLSETVKGKLSLGARIIQKGGRENLFRTIFSVSDGEKLLKASQCYFSTTADPIAGTLFISTQKIAFCSERDFVKILIPIETIKRANGSENVNNPAQKYIEIVTKDNFKFWFMGFVRYEKAFMNLQKVMSMSN